MKPLPTLFKFKVECLIYLEMDYNVLMYDIEAIITNW